MSVNDAGTSSEAGAASEAGTGHSGTAPQALLTDAPHAAVAAHRFSPAQVYRAVAIAEAVTWTILITVMVLKYAAGIEGWFTFAGGLVHGFVFIAYAASVIVVGLNQRWSLGLMALGIVTAIVPYATVPFDRRLERSGRLAGSWRTEASGHPRDSVWIDRMLRWFLARPALLLGVAVAAVTLVVAVLLVLGPPGG